MENSTITFITDQLKALTSIPSPSGFTKEVAQYLVSTLEEMGFTPERSRKGNVCVTIGGEGSPLILAAHVDTLGAMVRSIKSNGRLRPTTLGGHQWCTADGENCIVHTRDGKVYTGVVLNISYQGDSRGAEVFSRLGITTEFTSQGVKLKKTGKAPERLEEDFIDIPDLAQTFVVTCALLNIPFRFTGLQSLKIKETDRIAALRAELKKLGYMIKEENDSILMWNGERCEPEETPVIETYEDHRMAMAFAPAIIRHPNLLIADPQVVTKSYPGYWEDLKQAGFQVINEG